MILNLSPAIYEAKINLEFFKSKYFVKVTDDEGTYLSPINRECQPDILVKFEFLCDSYYNLVEQAAKDNGTIPSVIDEYISETYNLCNQ